MEIVLKNLNDLKPYSKNARTHNDEQIDKIAASIKEFGFTNPILIDGEDGIIAGHGRLKAALLIGLEHVPTIDLSHLSETQRRAYIIADNRLALDAGWDSNLLYEELSYLKSEDYDLLLTGMQEEEIENYLNPEVLNDGLCDEDDAPLTAEDNVTKLGDVWILGEHRLMCGDSTEATAVSTLVGNKKPVLMVTDPPYGVKYDPSWRDDADLGVGERSRGLVKNDDKVDWTDAYTLFPGDVAYVWHAGVYSPAVASHLENCGFKIISQIIWVKQHFALSRGDYHWQHEPCWYAVKDGKNHNWQGARDQATTWEIKNNNSFGNSNKEETWGHGTQKPLECMSRPIENNTMPNDYVYDPFGGSGTTLIACEKLGRKCLMMELDEKYCDVIVKRWEKFSGKKAILESTGEAFNCGDEEKGS